MPAGQIFVDREAGLRTLELFNRDAREVTGVRDLIKGSRSSLGESWKGRAAAQAGATLEDVDGCLKQAQDALLGHCNMVALGMDSFAERDEAIASALRGDD